MTTIHLIYPTDNSAITPGAIGWHLREALSEKRFDVVTHDWEATYRIPAQSDSIILGHPHPSPWTVFRRSVKSTGWHLRVCLFPTNGDIFQYAFAYQAMLQSDLVFPIMGPEWANFIDLDPQFALLRRKIKPLDLAIKAEFFSPLPKRNVVPAERRVLYIGHTGNYKAPAYLEAIRAEMPDVEFGWMGAGKHSLKGFTEHGRIPTYSQEGREILSNYHFLLSVGHADANPTTVLESMSLGLLPITTRGSGWSERQGVHHIPFAAPREAAAFLRAMLRMPTDEYCALLRENRQRVESEFGWSNFTDAVIAGMEEFNHGGGEFELPSDSRLKMLTVSAQAIAAIMGPRIALAHAYFSARGTVSDLRDNLPRRKKREIRIREENCERK